MVNVVFQFGMKVLGSTTVFNFLISFLIFLCGFNSIAKAGQFVPSQRLEVRGHIESAIEKIERKIDHYTDSASFFLQMSQEANRTLAKERVKGIVTAAVSGVLIAPAGYAWTSHYILIGCNMIYSNGAWIAGGATLVAAGTTISVSLSLPVTLPAVVWLGDRFVSFDQVQPQINLENIHSVQTITFPEWLHEANSISQHLLNKRESIERTLRPYIYKRESKVRNVFVNWFNLSAIHRQEATWAYYTYLANWYLAVARDFREKWRHLNAFEDFLESVEE